jgi:predicted DNA-binding transcriptional regulator YafY
MGIKNIYERFIWFDSQVRAKKYPNTTALANQFEVSTKTAQRDIDFMRDRLLCPLDYDPGEKGYYYENDTFTLPMVYLTSGELSSLLMARKILQDVSGGSLGDEISTILQRRRLNGADHPGRCIS